MRSLKRRSRFSTPLFLLLFLSACATQPPADEQSPSSEQSATAARDPVREKAEQVRPPSGELPALSTPQEAERLRQQRLAPLTVWRTRGKVAYKSPDESGSATVDWHQHGKDSELRLSGPLGMGTTRISPMGDALLIERDGIERLYPANAAPWLGTANGTALFPLPIGSVPYWIRGFADPSIGLDRREFDNGLPSLIEQDGWSIRFERYREVNNNALPSRLLIAHSESQLSLRLILRKWEFD
ncbi:MAG: lipoprotein insertase outer membrane protein LolB [Pseudomonadota bacterium]